MDLKPIRLCSRIAASLQPAFTVGGVFVRPDQNLVVCQTPRNRGSGWMDRVFVIQMKCSLKHLTLGVRVGCLWSKNGSIFPYPRLKWVNPWSPGVERNIGFLCTIHVPPGLRGLIIEKELLRRYVGGVH